MRKATSFILAVVIVLCWIPALKAQDSDNFKEQFRGHFDYASRVLSLAEKIPEELYAWRPGDGVMSVEEVYTHIARYNYYYLEENLGIPAPDDVNIENIESITGKEKVVNILKNSIEHVKETISDMPNSKLQEGTQLYGNTVNGQAVLIQLITHKSEHVGQSIAYARMNGIVPPWSE